MDSSSFLENGQRDCACDVMFKEARNEPVFNFPFANNHVVMSALGGAFFSIKFTDFYT